MTEHDNNFNFGSTCIGTFHMYAYWLGGWGAADTITAGMQVQFGLYTLTQTQWFQANWAPEVGPRTVGFRTIGPKCPHFWDGHLGPVAHLSGIQLSGAQLSGAQFT